MNETIRIIQKELQLFIILLFLSANLHAQNAETCWGFQEFEIPSSSITIEAGGDIQSAINSLPNGGTVYLGEGSFLAKNINLPSNIVIQGAGIDLTSVIFSDSITNGETSEDCVFGASAYLNGSYVEKNNIIIKDLKVNATGSSNHGIYFLWGVDNILLENIEVFGAFKSNLIVYNAGWDELSNNITIKNVLSYNATQNHAIAVRFAVSVLIDNCTTYGQNGGIGWDMSRVNYVEICNSHSYNNLQGCKFPGSNHIYMHDNLIENNSEVGIKFNKLDEPPLYCHLKNNTVTICASGVVDWGDTFLAPTFEELIVEGDNDFSDNSVDGEFYNNLRARGVSHLYEYQDNVGLVVERNTGNGDTSINSEETTFNPEADNVGYISWGNPSNTPDCDSSLSITSINNNKFYIYPNPVTDNIYISQNQEEIKNYTIINVIGQRVDSGIIVSPVINISHINQGVYFIIFKTKNTTVINRFIKK